MKFEQIELAIPEIKHVVSNYFEDQRGIFSRYFCDRELASILGRRQIKNVNFSRSNFIGTVRGLHMQRAPSREMKCVRCIRGVVFDVAVDMRLDSPTYLQWVGRELHEDQRDMLVIPEGFAHGFQALTDRAELLYLTTQYYDAAAEVTVNALDSRLNISWPLPVVHRSDKDVSAPLLNSD